MAGSAFIHFLTPTLIWIISIILLLVIFMCTGCNIDGNKRKVNILNWSSYIPFDVILDFERETGISVNYATYSSNDSKTINFSLLFNLSGFKPTVCTKKSNHSSVVNLLL